MEVSLRASTQAINLIKELEGWSAHCYADGAGYKTVGWGHLVDKNENCPDPITKEQGEAFLAQDVAEAEHIINSTVDVKLLQREYDSLVSFVYNVGGTAWAKSETLKLINQGHLHRVPARLMMWSKITSNGKKVDSEGLINRRLREVDLWRGK